MVCLKKLLAKICTPFKKWIEDRRFKKRLKELQKKDPFIYKQKGEIMAKGGYRKPAGFKHKEPSPWKPAKPKKTYTENPKGKVWRKPPKPESTTD